jgi:hypothetical protein
MLRRIFSSRCLVSMYVLPLVLALCLVSQAGALEMTFEVLNPADPVTGEIVVTQGDLVEVSFFIDYPDSYDLIRMVNAASGAIIDSIRTGGQSSGVVQLDSSPSTALGPCDIIFYHESRSLYLYGALAVVAAPPPPEPPTYIEVESAEDLQAAVDAIADEGGEIVVREGSYELAEPLVIEGKTGLVIKGAGSGLKMTVGPITEIKSPPSQEITDADGDVILKASEALAALNIIGSDVQIENMKLRGGDASIIFVDGPGGAYSSGTIKDVVIEESGWGIVSLSPATLEVLDTAIIETRWHSIAVKYGQLLSRDLHIINPTGAGIYCEDDVLDIKDTTIENALTGGVVGVNCTGIIEDTRLIMNGYGNIILKQCSDITISNNEVFFSLPVLYGRYMGKMGNGILLIDTEAVISENHITRSHNYAMAFMGESTVSILENRMTCNGIGYSPNGIQSEMWMSYETYNSYDEDGSNFCAYCAITEDESCNADIGPGGLEAPAPIGGIE